jgi:hypothetical protein
LILYNDLTVSIKDLEDKLNERMTDKNHYWYDGIGRYYRVMKTGYSIDYLMSLSPIEFNLLIAKINEVNKEEAEALKH